MSPPWGGPAYLAGDKFDLNTMEPNGFDLFKKTLAITRNIAYFLPRNVDDEQLLELAKISGSVVEKEANYLNGKLKSVTCYFGDLVESEENEAQHQEFEIDASGIASLSKRQRRRRRDKSLGSA